MLWFIQHELWGLASQPELDREFHEAWRDGLRRRSTENFADAVVAAARQQPDATVFFHDYHLYLAPALVREARPDATLAHFVHIPWPADWTMLPEADAARDARGAARKRRRRLSHRALGAQLRRSCARPSARATADTPSRTIRSRSTSAEFDRSRRSDEVLAAERELVARGRSS